MAAKKAHVISGYINRNITSKLIGRHSPTRPCPVQTYGLAQCLANRYHAKNTCRTNGRIRCHIIRWTLKLRWSGIWRLFSEEKAEQAWAV